MATNFPAGLDSFTNPTASDAMDSVSVPHADQHANINDAVEALEAKVGVDSSAVATSLDYRVGTIESGTLANLNVDSGTLYVDSANNEVGVGQTSPTSMLHVGNSTTAGSMRVETTYGVDGFSVTTGIVRALNIYNLTSAAAANVYVAANGSVYRSTSSGKYKTSVETLGDEYADVVFSLRPVWFRSLCDDDPTEFSYYGLIAEEVAALDPRLVHFGASADCACEPDETGHVEHLRSCLIEPEGVQYDRLVPHLINIVQRQQAQIDSMTARLNALDGSV